MVARPAVLPYSSTTTTICEWSRLHLTQEVGHRLALRNDDESAGSVLSAAYFAGLSDQVQTYRGRGRNRSCCRSCPGKRGYGKTLVDHKLAEVFNRFVSGNGHDGGTRSHYFANVLVSKSDDGMYQFAIALFENAFFRARIV